MKTALMALVLVVSSTVFAQPALPLPDWTPWQPLVGSWVGDPAADGAVGGFSFAPDLQARVLVRRNVADYAKTKVHHEDLMVVYQDGPSTRADYWDNEGHVIHYVVTLADGGKKFSFVSDAVSGKPRFRLTYTITGTSTLALAFEIAPPATGDFKPYIKATAHKKP
jgi:hypothetical protein